MTHEHAVETLASERYLLDEMSELERHRFEGHYFECGQCAEDVRLGAYLREEVRAGRLADAKHDAPTVVAMPRRFWQRPPAAVPWAAAAALALVVGYQSFVAVPALREVVAPQALSPVMLRGATRGADPVVSVAPGQAFVTLGAYVDAPPEGRDLEYALSSGGGVAVVSGRAPLPAEGDPLMLLVPVDALAGPGQYTLVVRDAERPQEVLGEYEFIVSD